MKHTQDVPPLSDDELALIPSLKPAVEAMMRAFDTDLVRAHRMSHTEYVALMFLSEAPEGTLQLSDLAARCQQSLSTISRAVGRLEAEGLIRREKSLKDARASNAVLTDAGLARFEEAWPTHVASLRRHLFDQLEGVDLHALAMAFQRIATAGGEAPHIAAGPSRRT
ncbi:MarR family winged helix-turn-helix transcriptional regulator [Streptomyces phyllanthi]|uniref:Winged helix-turn-helix transcriptional regulator n=1 Tax=Streptomyces phyllanthi TaxID=1803180 RepID=A0A5N8W5Y8_9ACTN|nr:MarR family winged helix-turn-helix transcriptional regulator [Streptomyces phyllanthi]MPY42897.1 winged helix-turn-helix transcriptional regulator [Streptomyces phyllanthi]